MQYILLEDDISKLPLSVRLLNVLRRNGVNTVYDMLQSKEKKRLKNFALLGKKGVSEIEQLVENLSTGVEDYCIAKNEDEISLCRADNTSAKLKINEAYKYLIKELSEAYKLKPDICDEIITKTILNFPEIHGESLIYYLYENKELNNALHNKILHILEEHQKGISLENLINKLPKHLINTTIVEELLLTMEQQNELYVKDDVYIRTYPSVIDYLKTIKDERKRQILLDKLNGKTLQEIGNNYGITRERVRQICKKELRLLCGIAHKKGLHFYEDKYRYLFSKYDISKNDFTLAFNEPLSTYEYLKIVTVKNSFIKPIEDAAEDNDISALMRKQLERIIYKDYIIINDQCINKNRPSLVDYYIKTYCRNLTKYEDFEQGYNTFLNNLGLLRDNLELHGHTYENRLGDNMYILWNQWRRFRYYDIMSRSYDDLLKNINLMQYDGLEISTLKLFRENPALMEEYDIRDEYELHNLLRKIWDKSDTKVNFKRMPTIEIGVVDRDAQIWSLLLQYAPVSSETFGALYEELYGAKAATVIAGYMKNFDKYFFNGIYSINIQNMPENEYEVLCSLLNEDYYTVQDVQKIYLREFPSADITYINSYTLKKLGFRIHFGYIIRNTYANATDYFNKILTEHDTVDMRNYPRSIQHISTYNSELHRLLKEREIVEFAPYQYINIRKLNQFGVTKETMEDYCKSVSSFVKSGEFFTIHSIISDGFSHSLDSLGFDEIFYSAVLFEDKVHFSCHKFGSTRIFINGISENVVTDMLRQIIEKDGKINIYNLIGLLENHYGIIVSKDKLVSKIRSTDMYYDAIMETAYINYDKYFEEV